MLLNLWLPVLLSGVALFFASFLSWMVFQLHRKDWLKLPREDEFMACLTAQNAAAQSYMFPACENAEQRNSEAFQQKWKTGPCGVLTVFGKVNMGRNLGLTFIYFLVISACLAYLAVIASLPPGASFLLVFRFVGTAGLLIFLSAMVQHSIWFHNRITGHVIESVLYACITGAIFGGLWPTA